MKKDKIKEIIMESEDPFYELAKELVVKVGYVRASLLQRNLKIGYAKSAYLIELLEEKGVISEPDENWKRKVLLKPKVKSK